MHRRHRPSRRISVFLNLKKAPAICRGFWLSASPLRKTLLRYHETTGQRSAVVMAVFIRNFFFLAGKAAHLLIMPLAARHRTVKAEGSDLGNIELNFG